MKAIVVFLAILVVGFSKPAPQGVARDLQDILDLIPFNEIKKIVRQYLKFDGALAEVVIFLQGDAWQNLITDNQAVQNLIAFLTDGGIPVNDYIAAINKFIQTLVPKVDPDDNGSLTDFLDEVVSVVDLDHVIAAITDKVSNCQDFQTLFERISSEDARELVEEVRQIDEVQRIGQKLRDFGVPTDGILATVYEFLGWN